MLCLPAACICTVNGGDNEGIHALYFGLSVATQPYEANMQTAVPAAGDPQQCARVNSALDWYHGSVRMNAAGLTWHRVIGKNMKQPVSEGQAKQYLAGLNTTFQVWT